ncbi:MAG: glucosyltransferase domain-containing protein [Candidatus Spyradenecus sp.]
MQTLKTRLCDLRTFAEELLFASRWTLPLLLLLLGATYGRWLVDVSYTNDQILALASHPFTLIEQQRWGFSVLGLLGLMDRHIPFWSPFLGLALLTGAGILFAYYWRTVAPGTCSRRQLLFGLCLFLTFPLNCEILIYPSAFLWNGACYALVAAALLLSHEPHTEGPLRAHLAPRAWLLPALLLATAISAYESFLFVYLVGLLLTLLIRLHRGEITAWRDLLPAARKPLITLIAALIIRSLVIFAISFAVTYAKDGGGAAKTIAWFDVECLRDLLDLCLKLPLKFAYYYLIYAPFNIALALFWAALLGGAGLFLKRPHRLLAATLLLALLGSLFALSLMMGNVQPYRNCQSFALLVGCLLPLLLARTLRPRPARLLLAIALLFLCTKQTSLYFDADLRAWQRASFDYYTLAHDLQTSQALQKGKPVYFVGHTTHGASLTDSLLPHALTKPLSTFLPSPYQHAAWTHFPISYQARVILRERYGLTALPLRNPPGPTQAELLALAEREQIPAFPHPGYIREFDDKILIHAGSATDPSRPWRQRLREALSAPAPTSK